MRYVGFMSIFGLPAVTNLCVGLEVDIEFKMGYGAWKLSSNTPVYSRIRLKIGRYEQYVDSCSESDVQV